MAGEVTRLAANVAETYKTQRIFNITILCILLHTPNNVEIPITMQLNCINNASIAIIEGHL